MSLIDTIRAQYPHPRRANDLHSPCGHMRYCVGGALCLYFDIDGPYSSIGVAFPNEWDLRDALLDINPALTQEEAGTLALAIIKANDRGLFDQAWQLAAQALPPTTDEVQP